MAGKKATAAAPNDAKAVTKTDAVRAALAAGKEKPIDGSNWIKAEYGIDVTPQQYSTYKSIQKATAATKTARQPGRKPGVAKAQTAGNGMVALDDLELAKQLVGKVGAEQAKRLVGLFE